MDLLVEMSDDWIEMHHGLYTPEVCARWANAFVFARVWLYADTSSKRLCNRKVVAACGVINHGISIIEAQFKRECIIRRYLRSTGATNTSRWVLIVDQDTVFNVPLVTELIRRLPSPRAPVYVKQRTRVRNLHVVMAFFLSTRACLSLVYDSMYIECKRDYYSCRRTHKKDCEFRGVYDSRLYNNDHFASFCLMRFCQPLPESRKGAVFLTDFNLKRRRQFNRKASERMISWHHTLPNVTWVSRPSSAVFDGLRFPHKFM